MRKLFDEIELPKCSTGIPLREKWINELLMEVCYSHKVSLWKVRSNQKDQYLVDVRADFARKAIQNGFLQHEIASAINRERSAISYYKRQYQK